MVNGFVVVYVGDCDGGVGDFWLYEDGGDGWQQVGMEILKLEEVMRGFFFMGGMIVFFLIFVLMMDELMIYIYGGMCFFFVMVDVDNIWWQLLGNYMKIMMSFGFVDDDKKDVVYVLDVVLNGGFCIFMVGFIIIGLFLFFLNVFGVVIQQVGYVFLGGYI